MWQLSGTLNSGATTTNNHVVSMLMICYIWLIEMVIMMVQMKEAQTLNFGLLMEYAGTMDLEVTTSCDSSLMQL